ncbi:MAG: PhoPQ-activated pathogenicity-related family protein [Fimbriimonadales bacterium]|nr:PhoPQ-activated pathogenicity-related family protein [Fimbriimonadales bacterium]
MQRLTGWLLTIGLMTGAYADLASYVNAPSPFEWSKSLESKIGESQFVELTMISQKWREFTWRHRVRLVKPKELKHTETAILYITGSGDGRSELQIVARAVERVGAIGVILHDVPNQPLIRPDLVEDNLIAHTYVQFWETGDPTWPLLFPMVKSAVRAMDAVQEFARREWGLTLKDFVITGASKRGWTTWLTAAIDKRARAIAPMVFDNLNFFQQMPHQLKQWGRYSEQIAEYYTRGLMDKMLTERGKQLVGWVDPYSYRARYTMPILIINGANDPYWTVDAARFYFDDLPSKRKYALYVPNGGHNLGGDFSRVVNSLCAFYLMSLGKLEFPSLLNGTHSIAGNEVIYRLRTDREPEFVDVWVARRVNDTDFRPARWEPVRARKEGNQWVARIPRNGENLALFAEATYRAETGNFSLCTVPVVVTK